MFSYFKLKSFAWYCAASPNHSSFWVLGFVCVYVCVSVCIYNWLIIFKKLLNQSWLLNHRPSIFPTIYKSIHTVRYIVIDMATLGNQNFLAPEQHLSGPSQVAQWSRICLQCRRHKRHEFDPGLGRPTGERNGSSLQYFCLGSSMDREAWWATVQGVSQKSQTWLATKE